MAEQLLDYEGALDRLGGDEEFLTELLEELLSQFDENINDIESAVKSKNFDALKSLSHSLKGASANLNVVRMANHFKQLEQRANEKNVDGADDLLERVRNDREELAAFLQKN